MESGSKKVVIAAIFGNLAIAAGKFVVAAFTGSSAMLSEGIHSVVDTGNGVLMLHGIGESQKPADARYPFGRGKELYFWALIVAISIFAVGGGMSVYEGILHIIHPVSIENPVWNYWMLGFATFFESLSLRVAIKEVLRIKRKDENVFQFIRRSKDPSTYTIVLEDAAAMLGLIFAFAGILLGQLLHQPWIDGAASVAIGLLLMAVAAFLTVETKGLLVGESADPAQVEAIKRTVLADPEIETVGELLTMQLGPHDVLVNIEVNFKPGLSVVALDAALDRIERDMRAVNSDIKRVFIEAGSLRGKVADTPSS
ncbi:MAG: cation transporter [Acidobacteria bacterium]|nr:MAG: cation transporter [Acidobacteriota bacterium]